jgi:hypothetical protein
MSETRIKMQEIFENTYFPLVEKYTPLIESEFFSNSVEFGWDIDPFVGNYYCFKGIANKYFFDKYKNVKFEELEEEDYNRDYSEIEDMLTLNFYFDTPNSMIFQDQYKIQISDELKPFANDFIKNYKLFPK